jgi:predicted Holliday junction resolvase-like endonuclease
MFLHHIIITNSHASHIAFIFICVVITMNVLNNIHLQHKVYHINRRLTKEVRELKERLQRYEEDCLND